MCEHEVLQSFQHTALSRNFGRRKFAIDCPSQPFGHGCLAFLREEKRLR